MRKIFLFLLSVATPVLAQAQTPRDTLSQVMDDHWNWWLSTHPVEATARGVRTYDDRIYDLSLTARAAQIKAEQAFVARLEAIGETMLAPADRVNRAVLLWMLRDDIAGEAHQAERLMLFTTYYGWHQGFAGMGDGLPFYDRADYDSYLTRLSLYPKQNGDASPSPGRRSRAAMFCLAPSSAIMPPPSAVSSRASRKRPASTSR